MRDWSVLWSFRRLPKIIRWRWVDAGAELFNDLKVDDFKLLGTRRYFEYAKDGKICCNWLLLTLHFMAWDYNHMWTSDDDKMRHVLNPLITIYVSTDIWWYFPIWWLIVFQRVHTRRQIKFNEISFVKFAIENQRSINYSLARCSAIGI